MSRFVHSVVLAALAAAPLACLNRVAASDSGAASSPARQAAASAPPHELAKVTLPPYVIEPPDILKIEGLRLVPKTPRRLEAADTLQIRVPGALPEYPIDGEFPIDESGYVNLGPAYGRFKFAGLTLDEAQAHLHEDLTRRFQLAHPNLSVSMVAAEGVQPISGQHIVAMDGRVYLGVYGAVYVTGMTIPEARAIIEKHLAKDFHEPTVSVDVLAYNSKIYYIITKNAGLGDGVTRVPITGNETVLDAVATHGGFSPLGMEKMWVARPANNGVGQDAILPVDWDAIAQGTSVETNYQLLPGDRLIIEPKQRAAEANPPTAAVETPYRLEEGVQYYAPEPPRERITILGPITSGAEIVTLDPPTDEEVLRVLEKSGTIPGIPVERKRDRSRVRIVKQKIANYVDAPRDYPLIGRAQNHHAHYKCTIYSEDGREVIYVDHNHLHMAAKEGADAAPADAAESVEQADYDSRPSSRVDQSAPAPPVPFAAEAPTVTLALRQEGQAASEQKLPLSPDMTIGDLVLAATYPQPIDFGKSTITHTRASGPPENRMITETAIGWDDKQHRPAEDDNRELVAGDQVTVRLPSPTTQGKRRLTVKVRPPFAPRPLPPVPNSLGDVAPAPAPGAVIRRPTPGAETQVLFKISLIRDRSGDVAELGCDLREAGEHIGDSSTLLGALRVLEKHGLIEVYSRPEIITVLQVPGRFAFGHEMPREGEATQADVERWAVQITPRHMDRDEFGRTVFTEIEMTEGGDLHDGTLIHEGKTLILATRRPHQPHKKLGAGQTYLVVTPEIVE